MHSVYSSAAVRPSSSESAASGSQRVLEGALQVNRERLEQLPLDDPQRQNLVRLGMLIRDLGRARACSSGSRNTARAFCLSCRCLGATQGQCSMQPLDRCMLLKGASVRIVHPAFTEALM